MATWKAATALAALTLAAAYSAHAALSIERVSVSSAEASGNSIAFDPAINADGRYISFSSEASNLVPGDSNFVYEVFVRDVTAGTTERVALSSLEVQGDSASSQSDISDDGSIVSFGSNATNLIDGQVMPSGLVYARNRTAGTTELISQSTGGVIANGSQDTPAISGNGRFVAFMSNADNLVSPANHGFPHLCPGPPARHY